MLYPFNYFVKFDPRGADKVPYLVEGTYRNDWNSKPR